MNTAIPASLADALTDFLNDCRTERSGPYGEDDSFSLVEFLAEAIFCAESNEFHGVPAVSALLERLDECLDHHRTASEVRQSHSNTCFDSPESRILSHEVFAWFDAPSNPHPNYTREGTGL